MSRHRLFDRWRKKDAPTAEGLTAREAAHFTKNWRGLEDGLRRFSETSRMVTEHAGAVVLTPKQLDLIQTANAHAADAMAHAQAADEAFRASAASMQAAVDAANAAEEALRLAAKEF